MFKIRSVAGFSNCFQNEHFTNPVLTDCTGNERQLKGRWCEEVFGNENPLVLELACGKGDYTLALAEKYPHKNFLGIDVKGARIFTGAKTALDNGLHNVAFARMRIENITNFFAQNEVSEIWVTFPDPFPKKGDAKRRLTAPAFIARYRNICRSSAILHLKTDDLPLFHFTREVAQELQRPLPVYEENIYKQPLQNDDLAIQTFYEKQHLANGRTINYLQMKL